MPIQHIPSRHRSRLALLVGNGINRYGSRAPRNSWDELLLGLAAQHLPRAARSIPPGVSSTEFFDLLEIASQSGTGTGALQAAFCAPMQHWQPDAQHHALVAWAQAHATPVLTTNFDSLLAQAAGATLQALPGQPFTDFYPWSRYFGHAVLPAPDAGFGIWHINGTVHYKRSIRLGLTHYMGSVERARGWLHKGSGQRLFGEGNLAHWPGANTWLHVLFSRPLLIFGLALEENEVFLRWLLIERARYFAAFPKRRQPAWYAYAGSEKPGKLFFLQSLGIEPMQVGSYDDLYHPSVWQ